MGLFLLLCGAISRDLFTNMMECQCQIGGCEKRETCLNKYSSSQPLNVSHHDTKEGAQLVEIKSHSHESPHSKKEQ